MARRSRRGWGSVRKLPSGRFQATFSAPDGARRTAPTTFQARADAEAWLSARRNEIKDGRWEPESRRAPETLEAYSERWLAARDLRPRTREAYRDLLDRFILPALGQRMVPSISTRDVEEWFYGMGNKTPTYRARAYGLLRTLLGDATRSGMRDRNPCTIRAGASAKRKRRITLATPEELGILTTAMPDRLQMMIPLATWCALRFGEATELRRKDILESATRVSVTRAVSRIRGGVVIGPPKTDAGVRVISVPPHLVEDLRRHVERYAPNPEDLLFPAADGVHHLAQSTFDRPWTRARKQADRLDLRFHDLRHTGATLAARTGATLKELQSRIGHSTPAAAMLYQHAAQERDAELAASLSELWATASDPT